MWWKVTGRPTVFVSCCVMSRERVAAEMQARTPVGSCCYILDQEEGLTVTKTPKITLVHYKSVYLYRLSSTCDRFKTFCRIFIST